MGSPGTRACRTEILKLMVTESTDVPFRAGFDHATSPELVGARAAAPALTWPGLSCGSRLRNGTAASPTTSWRMTSPSPST
jgi:hypothetical protein